MVRNDAVGFAATAASLRQQRGAGWEWLVVDGASTDGTVDLVRKEETRIAWWVSEPDQGVYDAMNKGLAAAGGDYVIFLNAGDILFGAHALAQCGRVIRACSTRPAMVFADTVYRYASGRRLWRSARPLDSCLWHRMPSTHQATAFRRDLHQFVPYDLSFRVCADYDVICRVHACDPTHAYLPRPFAVMVKGGRSISHRRALRRLVEATRVQRHTLGSGRHLIAASALRRSASIVAEYLLAHEHRVLGRGIEQAHPAAPRPSPSQARRWLPSRIRQRGCRA